MREKNTHNYPQWLFCLIYMLTTHNPTVWILKNVCLHIFLVTSHKNHWWFKIFFTEHICVSFSTVSCCVDGKCLKALLVIITISLFIKFSPVCTISLSLININVSYQNDGIIDNFIIFGKIKFFSLLGAPETCWI